MDQELRPARPRQAAFSALRSLARERPQEQCDVCGAGLPSEHAHLLDPAVRQIICVCDGCAISVGDQQGSRYRRIPRRVRALPDFRMSDALWDGLLIPVGMAFFFRKSDGKVAAFYPGPAGAAESLLDLDMWAEVEQENPVLQEMQTEVEALLVNRVRGAREYFLVPIDKCYELTGLIRVRWRGLSGGSEVWDEIAAFFARLKKQSLGERARA